MGLSIEIRMKSTQNLVKAGVSTKTIQFDECRRGAMTLDFMKSGVIAPSMHPPNWRVFVETFDFIRFWVDFRWNPPDFMNVSFWVMIKYRSFFRKTKNTVTTSDQVLEENTVMMSDQVLEENTVTMSDQVLEENTVMMSDEVLLEIVGSFQHFVWSHLVLHLPFPPIGVYTVYTCTAGLPSRHPLCKQQRAGNCGC